MLVIILVLSAFLTGLFTLIYIEDKNDMWKLVMLFILVIVTLIITILTYVEAYYI